MFKKVAKSTMYNPSLKLSTEATKFHFVYMSKTFARSTLIQHILKTTL